MPTMDPKLRSILLIFIITSTIGLPHAAAYCRKTSTGLTPLTEMGDDLYQGEAGGLYPDGDTLPPEVQARDMDIAGQIQPRDGEGKGDPEDGKIVFLSIGMSITSMEFTAFKALSDQDPRRNPEVRIVDGAFSGISASAIANPETNIYWTAVENRLIESGVSPPQVQVAWLKEVNRPERFFPRSAEDLEADLKVIVQMLKDRFVNLQIVYLSSRSYGGYGVVGEVPEPYAYETGFAVKWLIEAQLNGDPELNHDPSRGPVKAPMLRWGPYLWADGVNPRESDNLSWMCSDFEEDGAHPSEAGQMKVAKIMLDFLQRDPVARVWYLSEEAQSRTIEPLVFTQPFPTEWLIALAAASFIGAAVLIRFVRRKGGSEE